MHKYERVSSHKDLCAYGTIINSWGVCLDSVGCCYRFVSSGDVSAGLGTLVGISDLKTCMSDSHRTVS
jgi:hypothetical protein